MSINSIQFEDISPKTLPFVQSLLSERNGTLPAYTEWKYGKNSPQGFRGVVALKGQTPVGCFGIMPKILQTENEKIPCGWFADWYTTPPMRGSGLGTALLNEITKKGYMLFFGHPGPQRASKICIQNGWQKIPFQSSRRFIVSPYSYYGKRTHYFTKRIFLTFQHYTKKIIQPTFLGDDNYKLIPREGRGHFIDQENWHHNQPVNPKIIRAYKTWVGKKININFCDDTLPTGETRRRILKIENIQESPQDLFSFIEEIRNSSVSYVEFFTTDKLTDHILGEAGAIKFQESPILRYGNNQQVQDVIIQGIDRENWLYSAGKL